MAAKVILIHGNGGSTTQDIWFPNVKNDLEGAGIPVIAETFPDNDLARASFWLPFLKDTLQADENTVLVGHSSGAVAAMRFAEQHKILGSVLVGACYTDLGIERERLSGYYDTPWNWGKIRANQKWITLFAASDDPWIPIQEPRHIHHNLNCEYHEYKDEGHFGGDRQKTTFPELSHAILRNLKDRALR